ncbi:MAG: hypothetical protein RIE56_10195 [Amphiplicatus sp.]
MSKRSYKFDIVAEDGDTLESRDRRCYAATAPYYAEKLLARNPRAAAVFAVERRGHAAHAIYRS